MLDNRHQSASKNQDTSKMGQFIKSIFASCLGFFIAIIVIFFLSLVVFGKMATSLATNTVKVKQNSVLRLKLDAVVPDKTNNVTVSTFDLKNTKVLGLHEIIATIKHAKKDDNIKGIYIDNTWLPLGFSSSQALRDALLDFKSEGKFIYSYAKYYTQGAYYLSTAADEIYVNPIGLVDFKGYGAAIPFYKDMLDKLGVKMEVFYAGKFKSATEPYRRNNLSDEARLQMREYIDERYKNLLTDISEAREIPVSELHRLADEYVGADPQNALNAKMVDVVGYENMVEDAIRERIGLKKNAKINFISLKSYNGSYTPQVNYQENNKIAVIYAEGNVVDGEGDYGMIGDDKYTKIINKLRRDDKVDAIVLRVNSGGGSAMSSENIWNALTQLKEENSIPIIVSMGDVAASGGYYIACPADQIYAETNTLTGSIGVFSMFPNASELFNDKIGIHYDTVKTGKNAVGLTPFFDLSEAERLIMQRRTDSLYATFLKRVSDGRGLSVKEVNEIAQGRVWTGTKAKEIGLVDEIGLLSDAIAKAAELADIDDYRLVEYPKIKDPIQRLLEDLTDENMGFTAEHFLKEEFGEWYPAYEHLKEIKNASGPQMRLPYIIPAF